MTLMAGMVMAFLGNNASMVTPSVACHAARARLQLVSIVLQYVAIFRCPMCLVLILCRCCKQIHALEWFDGSRDNESDMHYQVPLSLVLSTVEVYSCQVAPFCSIVGRVRGGTIVH